MAEVASTTVWPLKAALEPKSGITVARQVLQFNGYELRDFATLNDVRGAKTPMVLQLSYR